MSPDMPIRSKLREGSLVDFTSFSYFEEENSRPIGSSEKGSSSPPSSWVRQPFLIKFIIYFDICILCICAFPVVLHVQAITSSFNLSGVGRFYPVVFY